jgi:transposase
MSPPRFTPEFKEEAVRQITERGYSVAEVSALLGVSAHNLYKYSFQSDFFRYKSSLASKT